MTETTRVFLTKELRDLRANPQVWPGYLLLPLLGVVLPTVFIAVGPLSVEAARDPDLVTLFNFAAKDPQIAAYPESERLARLVVREFGGFFLLMPVMLSAMSAALAIAVEKQQRTLEPILATPLSDRELLVAKLVAALVPALGATWIAALLYGITMAIVTAARLGSVIVPGPAFFASMVLVAPLGGTVAALIGMRVSIKAKDVQGAVQSASLWVIPAGIGLVATVGRLAARSLFGVAVGAMVLSLVCWWLLRGNLRRFEREEILTRWT